MSKIYLDQNINYSSTKQKRQKSNILKTQKLLLIILRQLMMFLKIWKNITQQKIEKYFRHFNDMIADMESN